jgi:hypothetical protein
MVPASISVWLLIVRSFNCRILVKRSATIFATMATGTATASMARGDGGGGDDAGFVGGVHVNGSGGRVHVGRFVGRMINTGLRGNPRYGDPWRDYGTDGACSFDVVTARYVEPDGIWHYCP